MVIEGFTEKTFIIEKFSWLLCFIYRSFISTVKDVGGKYTTLSHKLV